MNNQPPMPTGPSMIASAQPQPDPMHEELQLSHSNRKHDTGRVFMIVALVIACLALATFIGLFIWMYIQYNDVKTDVDGQINAAVAVAKSDLTEELETEFLKREKEPNKTFAGPEDYGGISFKYPKTWSVYVQSDAISGGNYQAFFSPGEVEPIKNETPNALRLTISTQSFDSVTKTYESYVSSGKMTMSVITVNGASANLYRGTLTNGLVGAVCIFKIRDKTVIMQSDAELYLDDFNSILNTVTYNS